LKHLLFQAGNAITQSAKYTLKENNRVLRVNNISAGDFGEYKCEGKGTSGKIKRTVTLKQD